MKKILLILIFVLLQHQKDYLFSAVHEEYETKWRLGIGTGYKHDKELFTEPRLYINIDTTLKGESTPKWSLNIYFSNREPESFFPIMFKDGAPYVLGASIGALGGGIGVMAAVKYAGKDLILKEIGAGAFAGSLTGLGIVILLADVVPPTVRGIEKAWKNGQKCESLISFDYSFSASDPTIDSVETLFFSQRYSEQLCNRDDDASLIRRSPSNDGRRSVGVCDLFSCTLNEPIRHIADAYEKLLLITQTPLNLMFQQNGMSNDSNRYVRNWNSFAILASAKCFGIPFSTNPRLEEYVEDARLRERWGKSIWPTYDNVIEQILVPYSTIQEQYPSFRMNRDFVMSFGKRLDGWIWSSGITCRLSEIVAAENAQKKQKEGEV